MKDKTGMDTYSPIMLVSISSPLSLSSTTRPILQWWLTQAATNYVKAQIWKFLTLTTTFISYQLVLFVVLSLCSQSMAGLTKKNWRKKECVHVPYYNKRKLHAKTWVTAIHAPIATTPVSRVMLWSTSKIVQWPKINNMIFSHIHFQNNAITVFQYTACKSPQWLGSETQRRTSELARRWRGLLRKWPIPQASMVWCTSRAFSGTLLFRRNRARREKNLGNELVGNDTNDLELAHIPWCTISYELRDYRA